MHLQGDVAGSSSLGAMVQSEAGDGSSGGLGVAGRAGILNSVADA